VCVREFDRDAAEVADALMAREQEFGRSGGFRGWSCRKLNILQHHSIGLPELPGRFRVFVFFYLG
jgi:hypothetical protein